MIFKDKHADVLEFYICIDWFTLNFSRPVAFLENFYNRDY